MKKILLNALVPEEIRIAVLDDGRLHNVYFDISDFKIRRNNIYKARITHYESSLEAFFVDFGSSRSGFLPTSNVFPGSLPDECFDDQGKYNNKNNDLGGHELLIQILKDERENKGAGLTTELTIRGSYLIINFGRSAPPTIPRSYPSSRRREMLELLGNLTTPENCQVGLRRIKPTPTRQQLQKDVEFIDNIYQTIKKHAESLSAPDFIYQDSNIVSRIFREFCHAGVEEIVVDSENQYDTCRKMLEIIAPDVVSTLRLHDKTEPLFELYGIEDQIKQLYKRNVRLASGGEIVIDYTEALTAIDINSSQFTAKDSIEDTAIETNLEAMDEIARQLRLRDIGGLIVIDIIDMKDQASKQKIIDRLTNAVKPDQSHVRIGEISSFHLLEMTRERRLPSIRDVSFESCKLCKGVGRIPNLSSAAASLLREIRNRASNTKNKNILVRAHYDLANHILNNQRSFLERIYHIADCEIAILPDLNLLPYQHELIEYSPSKQPKNQYRESKSLKLPTKLDPPEAIEKPAFRLENFVNPDKYPDRAGKHRSFKATKTKSWLASLWSALFSNSAEPKPDKKSQADKSDTKRQSARSSRGGYRGNQPRGSRDRRPRKRHGGGRPSYRSDKSKKPNQSGGSATGTDN